jgi:hypothetical protein
MSDQTDTPPAAGLDKLHEQLIGPIVNAIIRPTLYGGGSVWDVLALLESVSATVLAIAANPAGDQAALDTFSINVRKRLQSVRLGTQSTAGSA